MNPEFDLDTVKMLMSIFVSYVFFFHKIILECFLQDSDKNGTISFTGTCFSFLLVAKYSRTHDWSCSTEFAGLWKYLSEWQNVFRHFDRDRSGTIERHELSEALRSFGYALSPQLLGLVGQKYCLYLNLCITVWCLHIPSWQRLN